MATRVNTKQNSAEVELATERVKALVTTKEDVSVADLIRTAQTSVEIARRMGSAVSTRESLPAPKGKLELSPDQLAVIDAVVHVAASAPAVPSAPEELSREDRQAHGRTWMYWSRLKAIVDAHMGTERAVLLNDLTLRGEREGWVDESTPRDKEGWAVIKRQEKVEGEDEVLSFETKAGPVNLTAEDLAAMEADGEITHEEYLDATEQVRVIKDSGFFRLMRKRPQLAGSVARRAKVSRPSVSLSRRNA